MPATENTTLYLLTPPHLQGEAARYGLTPAHLAYRVGGGPHLFRTQLPTPLRGGIMVLDAQGFDGKGEAETFCNEIVRECAARNFQGVFCDFDGPPLPVLARAIALLSPTFQKRGWALYALPNYAINAPAAKVVISSAISGGSLRQYLREAVDTFGQNRTVLGLEWTCSDFILPSRDGFGRFLNTNELEELQRKWHPNVYFSPDLCGNYFTFMPTGGAPHFILFDDPNSMAKKLDLAREIGISEAFLPYPENPEQLSELLREKS